MCINIFNETRILIPVDEADGPIIQNEQCVVDIIVIKKKWIFEEAKFCKMLQN